MAACQPLASLPFQVKAVCSFSYMLPGLSLSCSAGTAVPYLERQRGGAHINLGNKSVGYTEAVITHLAWNALGRAVV